MSRVFSPSDPNIPSQGFLLGTGGGWRISFLDVVASTEQFDARIKILQYALEAEGNPIPHDHIALDIAADRSSELEQFMQRLESIGFWKLSVEPPRGSWVQYFVAVHKELGLHYLIWDESTAASLPREFVEIHNEIRARLVARIEAQLPGAALQSATESMKASPAFGSTSAPATDTKWTVAAVLAAGAILLATGAWIGGFWP